MLPKIKEPWCYNKPWLLNHQRISSRLFLNIGHFRSAQQTPFLGWLLINPHAYMSATIFKIIVNPIHMKKLSPHFTKYKEITFTLSSSSPQGLIVIMLPKRQKKKKYYCTMVLVIRRRLLFLRLWPFPMWKWFHNFNFLWNI